MKKKILIAIASNSAGGAERAASYLANYFANMGDDVYFVNSDKSSDYYPLNSKVKVVKLDCDRSNKYINNIVLFFRLRKLLKEIKPTLSIAFLIKMEIPIIINSLLLNIPVFTSVRNDPDRYDRFTRIFRKLFYPKCSGIIFQSKKVARHKDFRNIRNKTIISNMLGNQYCNLSDFIGKEQRLSKIFSVGRLSKQKNHELLIKAFSQIADKIPAYSVEIYGEGEEYNTLSQLIVKLGMEERIFLKGNKKDVIIANMNYSLFVLSSDYEGFPNVLVEAMACGIPVISTNFASGVAEELINNDSYGTIVDIGNEVQLADAILGMITNYDSSLNMAKKSLYVRNSLAPQVICAKWYDYFESVLDLK